MKVKGLFPRPAVLLMVGLSLAGPAPDLTTSTVAAKNDDTLACRRTPIVSGRPARYCYVTV